jgi:indolepyruvate ferredoxin oxidoreductase alpha subunit
LCLLSIESFTNYIGNEAIAYGALSGGVAVATAYPGTPSTEIIETLEEFKDRFVHWATNEKVALELAYGAALAGARALTAMKHVGLNVAADPPRIQAWWGSSHRDCRRLLDALFAK